MVLLSSGAGAASIYAATALWWASGIEHRLERDERDTAQAIQKLEKIPAIEGDLKVVRAILERITRTN